jgi:hypothetical protein
VSQGFDYTRAPDAPEFCAMTNRDRACSLPEPANNQNNPEGLQKPAQPREAAVVNSRADVVEGESAQPARGASGRERALRFNRGVIGLGLVALMVMLLMPV